MLVLNLFRKNDPFLNVLLIITLVVLRLIYTFFGDLSDLNIQSSNSYLINEVLNIQLNPYGHIWISALFIAINTLLLNQILRENQAFSENNYLNGLVYLILTNASQFFFTFSGDLVALTCLLFALSLILSHVKQRASEENIFFTGVLMGLSVLFSSPMMIFIIFTLLVYVFYTRTIPRRYALSTFGFLFPFIIGFSLSLLGQGTFSLGYFFRSLFENPFLGIAWNSLVFIIFPLLILCYKLLASFGGIKMSNHQIHVQRVMFLLTLVVSYFFFVDPFGYGFLWLFSIPASYFITKTLLEIDKKWIKSSVFYLLVAHLVLPYLSAFNL
jgi:hypothetical protein